MGGILRGDDRHGFGNNRSGDDDFDYAFTCPKCGANWGEIIERPTTCKSWFGQGGKAKCGYCGTIFPIRILEEEHEHEEPKPKRRRWNH